ncbi:secretin N-terminal domain-containing protein [Thermodesulfobacteriota bacterium]
MKTIPAKRIFILFFFVFLPMHALNGVCQADVDVIPVHYRDASEVVPIVETLLSPEGKVTFSARTHSLVVNDTPESLQKIRAFLETFDTPVPQVRIRVVFHEDELSRDRSASASGSVSGDDWKIVVGGNSKDGVEIRADERKTDKQRISEYSVVTASGSPAYILTGVEIPHKQRWIYLCRRYAACKEDTVTYQKIDTGMEILPVVVGKRVNVKIIPRISDPTYAGGRVVSRFTRAATQLSVPLGEWVTIGGVGRDTNEVMRAILETGTGKQGENVAMSLLVEKLDQ